MTVAPADDETTVVVREATLADLLAVFRIEKASFDQPWPFVAFERHLDAEAFLVAVEDVDGTGGGPIVGYVVADFVPHRRRRLGHVKDLAVHPDRRGRGIGARLLEEAIHTLTTGGSTSVKLEVRRSNEPAIALYREFGFEFYRVVSGYYEDGEDAYVMLLDLRAPAD